MTGRMTQLAKIMAGPLTAYTLEGHENKERFHKEGKLVMRRLAKALGLEPGTYDVRSNKGGMAVSGEVTLHTERFYVQAHESCIGPRGGSVMYRLCDGRKDYCGKTNNRASPAELEDVDKFAEKLRNLYH